MSASLKQSGRPEVGRSETVQPDETIYWLHSAYAVTENVWKSPRFAVSSPIAVHTVVLLGYEALRTAPIELVDVTLPPPPRSTFPAGQVAVAVT